MFEVQSWMIPVGIAILSLVFYKFVLRVFFGLVIVPEDRIGLVTKKFVLFGKQTLPEGRIIATNGEAGFQGQTLAPGVYFGKWIWLLKYHANVFSQLIYLFSLSIYVSAINLDSPFQTCSGN